MYFVDRNLVCKKQQQTEWIDCGIVCGEAAKSTVNYTNRMETVQIAEKLSLFILSLDLATQMKTKKTSNRIEYNM